MSKILVVFTGGTIGSTVQTGTINLANTQHFKLLELFKQHDANPEIQFDCIQPLQILSENLYPSLWETLISAIQAQPLTLYDGIIVTHGTDTLAYTAAVLSFYFNQLDKPLLLVSSNYPLEHTQANGLQNFICAVEFIRQQLQSGVFVPYTNPQQTTAVHLGTRLASSLQLSGDFMSVQFKTYLQFANGIFTYTDKKRLKPNAPALPLPAQF
jgi:L-asparaginase/Glu-tRNA(Gln) amidotransferase subunit D